MTNYTLTKYEPFDAMLPDTRLSRHHLNALGFILAIGEDPMKNSLKPQSTHGIKVKPIKLEDDIQEQEIKHDLTAPPIK